MSYSIRYAKTSHTDIVSIHRFATPHEAHDYLKYIFGGQEDGGEVIQSLDPVNASFIGGKLKHFEEKP